MEIPAMPLASAGRKMSALFARTKFDFCLSVDTLRVGQPPFVELNA
jgi:hypothetical protein